MEEDIKMLEEFINNYKLVQEKYKDDEIQAEIERSCYFEEVPAQALENLLTRYKEMAIENQSYKDYYGNPPCYDDAKYIPKSKVKEKIDSKCKAFQHRTSIEKILECEFKRLEEELLREE